MSEQNSNPTYANEIMLIGEPYDTCTNCGRALENSLATIRDDLPKKFPAKVCPSCGRYFIPGSHELENYLITHYYLRRYKTRSSSLWEYAKDQIVEQETENAHLYRLKSTPGVALLLVLEDMERKEHEVFIVTDRTFENKSKNVVYCWSRTALILLTYAYHESHKGKTFKVRGKQCRITRIYENEDYRAHSLQIPTAVYLRKNGGFYDPVHPDYPLAIAMIYSPFSKHYEGMTVTCDTDENVWYVDSSKFREFIHKHGNPGIHIGFYKKTGVYGFDWLDLNDRSFLMDYGYNVSIKDNLPSSIRQEMLAEIVDLQIASVSDIVNHLNFCISSHAMHPGAIACWREDIEFISNYKVNPNRFLIAETVKRKK